MPRKKAYARPRRTRRPGYRRRRRRTRARMPRSLPGFPKTRMVRMRYVDNIILDPGGLGSLSKYVYRANSIYDPDYTTTGHQPLGRDQWFQFYNHYVVIGAKINVKFMYSATNANTGYACGIILDDDGITPTTLTEIAEQGLGKYRINAAVNYSPGYPQLTQTFSAKKFFNVTDLKDNFARIGAEQGANPAEAAYFTIWATDLNAADLGDIHCLVTISYLVVFSEPKTLAGS